MGIEPNFSQADFNSDLERRIAAIKAAIINRLKRLGEMCLIECRTNHKYVDRTGNLTASMGYVIVDHGNIIHTAGFGGSGKEGPAEGRNLANSLSGQFRDGYALIVVAGMNYAIYVEAKGFNVLTTSELLAERQLPIMIEQLKRNIGA